MAENNLKPKYNFKTFQDLLSEPNNKTSESNIIPTKSIDKKILHLNSLENYITQSSTVPKNLNISTTSNNQNKDKKRSNNTSMQKSNSNSKIYNTSYQSEYIKKVKEMEKYIQIVKDNAIDKNKKDLIEKTNKKKSLKNTIDIISTYVKLNRINNRNFALLTKGIQKETERLAFTSEYASRESFFFTQQMPGIRNEIEQMKTNIYDLSQETLILNNEKMLLEKELMELNDEIKKFNLMNNELNTQKENIKNTILLIKKHSELTREKMKLKLKETDELMNSLALLAKKAKEDNENYVSRRIMYNQN